MFVVTTPSLIGEPCYLRASVWTFGGNRDRAEEFPTVETAQAALDRAKKFMSAKVYRAAKIIPA